MQMNDKFFDDLLVSAPLERVVENATAKIADVARATAPVDEGDYRDGITHTVKRQKRVVGLVQATDEKSLIIESIHGTLVRATRTVGRGSGT